MTSSDQRDHERRLFRRYVRDHDPATREELVAQLRSLGDELGRTPTAQDIRSRRGTMPSASLYWHTFGSLSTEHSSWHVALHPSPLVVLPSSHASVPTIMLSPQMGLQRLGVPVQA